MRESPSMFIFEKLEDAGAEVHFHDPVIAKIPPTREHARLTGKASVPIDARALAGYDAVVICTEHSAVDYALIAKNAKLVVDTRNAMAAFPSENIIKA